MLNYQNNELGFMSGKKFFALSKVPSQPCFVYDLSGLRARIGFFKENVPAEIFYALKANFNRDVVRVIQESGVGIDVVSAGELKLALEMKFKPSQIVFSGVGKSHHEIELALEQQIKQINVESVAELMRIAEIAKKKKKKVSVALRLNPDVDPETHPYIRTGFRENKFGMGIDQLGELVEILTLKKDQLDLKGITIHIGSQILDLKPFADAINIGAEIFLDLKRRGFNITNFDVGGGVGIAYDGSDENEELARIKEYGALIKNLKTKLGCNVLCEPGRVLVGHFGTLVCAVEYIKETQHKNFVIVNSGMHHLIRPALYQAQHRILPVKKSESPTKLYDVVGPICESADVLGRDRAFPELKEGDFIAIADCGAYGSVMSSSYNLQLSAAEYAVDHGEIL